MVKNKKIWTLVLFAVAILIFTTNSSARDWVPFGNISLQDYYCVLNPMCVVGDVDILDGNLSADWCDCQINGSNIVGNITAQVNTSLFWCDMNCSWLDIFLNIFRQFRNI